MELLHSLGIDWRLFLAQLVNFTILLAILYRFLYKPILKLLRERTEQIDQGLKNAAEAEKKLATTAFDYDQKMLEARKQAQAVLDETKTQSAALKTDLLKKAQEEAEKFIADGRQSLEQEKHAMLKEARMELAGLVMSATKIVLGKVVTLELDRKINEEAARAMKYN